MAIVAEKINHLGGKIFVDTTPKKGTTFRVELPQTLATFSGILVEASGQRFLLPTTSVFKAVKVNKQDIKPIESKNTFRFLNETISLVSLADVLGLRKSKSSQSSQLQVMIVQTTSKTGFVVDKVIGEYEGMVKPLGQQLKHVDKMEGACFMGDGSVVPVLQVEELMEAARGLRLGSTETRSVKEDGELKKVLYAEDSITVRNMVRSHIEAAGFEVSTAVDGQAAYELLQKEAFDLVVSDIEMPRMNGFELTSKIKKDNALSHLPVILVTSLDSKADRDRGLESGANAYIVKSSFEKSNLIDTIKRLI
jgi:two-component system chemotaxis sensor kinase CheA